MTTYAICPHCEESTEENDHFPVADGGAYHVRCYQTAMIETFGQPDPFPLCDGCHDIIFEFVNGEMQITHHGQVNEGGEWRMGRFHPDCAPKPVDANGATEIEVEAEPVAVEADEPEPRPQDFDDNDKPICPMCGKSVLRTPTKFNGLVYHKACAAKSRTAADPQRNRRDTKRPRCVTCARPIDEEKLVECPGEVADEAPETYHKACYRKLMIDAGEPDPFPPPSKPEVVEKLKAGREKKVRERKAETVVCGICTVAILRAEFPDHVIVCATEARAKALAEVVGEA